MSKHLGIISNGSGKIGNVVLQRNNVQRARVRTIKNPNSKGQAIARMIAATASRSYSAMKGIVDHSFAGIEYGGKSMNYFIKNAMRDVRAAAIALTDDPSADVDFFFSPKTAGGVVPAAFLVSKGNLPTILIAGTLSTTEGGGTRLDAVFEAEGAEIRPDELAAKGLQAGDQLTFCVIYTKDGKPVFDYKRAILKADADMTATAFTSGMFEAGSDSALVTKLVAGGESLLASQIFTGIPTGDGTQVFGCVITSRKVDGQWQRSTERLAWVGDQDAADFEDYGYSTALPTWLDGGTSLAESDRYLNEG